MSVQNADLAFIDKIEELSAVPAVVMELMTLLSGPTDKKKESLIVKKIKLDPAMVAFVFKLCGSPLLGIRGQVTTVEHALNMIGFPRYKSMLMAYFLRNLYGKSEKKYIGGYLWEHSLYVGFICRELALHLEYAPERIEEAYIAGLLHDIGKLALFFHDSQTYEPLMFKADRERTMFRTLEENQYGFSHVEAGYYLAEKWALADLFKDSIRYHHRPGDYRGEEEIVRLVAFGNITAHYAIAKQVGLPGEFLEFYNLSEEKYENIINKIFGVLVDARLLQIN